jgi:hypothetical protein
MTADAPAEASARGPGADPSVVSVKRLPQSGSSALAASAVVQAALGIEFVLSGLNKFADPDYVTNFSTFVRANPGSTTGPLSPLVQAVVLPSADFFATLLKGTELVLGSILLIGAVEIGRRRLSRQLGASHGYEPVVAVIAALAGLIAAGLSSSIFLLMGGVLPTIMPGRAFTTAIPVELLIVPLGLSTAWLEFGRFLVLRQRPPKAIASAHR